MSDFVAYTLPWMLATIVPSWAASPVRRLARVLIRDAPVVFAALALFGLHGATLFAMPRLYGAIAVRLFAVAYPAIGMLRAVAAAPAAQQHPSDSTAAASWRDDLRHGLRYVMTLPFVVALIALVDYQFGWAIRLVIPALYEHLKVSAFVVLQLSEPVGGAHYLARVANRAADALVAETEAARAARAR